MGTGGKPRIVIDMQPDIQTKPPWVTADAVRDPLWLPDHFSGVAWVVDSVRALFANDSLDAWQEFCVLVDATSPTILEFYKRAQANHKWARGWMSARRLIQKRAFKRGEIPESAHKFDAAVIELADNLAKKYMLNSPIVTWIVLELATFTVLEIEPFEIDARRSSVSPIWDIVYGRQTTPEGRETHRETMTGVRANGWRTRKGSERWDTCCDWIEYVNYFKRNLKLWLESKKSGPTEYKAYHNASERFGPLEHALGVRRGAGAPKKYVEPM